MSEEKKTAPNKLGTMTVERLLDCMCAENDADQRFCFILGSGASYTSGIKTGVALMRQWREELLSRGLDYIRDCTRAANYDWEQCRRIFEEPVTSLKNEDYFTLYDIRFVGCPTAGYAELEKAMEDKAPNVGYYYLASILQNTQNRLVITTNFDSLTEDALFYYSGKHPLVLGHEKLAPYVSSVDRKPVVAKIHRDLLMDPMSRQEQMERLQTEWNEPLSLVLGRYIPVVVGYAGGDQTLMSLLEKLKLRGIFWCTLDREGARGLPEKARQILEKNHGYWVKIQGFDELMYRMANRMNHLPNLQKMRQAMDERHEQFRKVHEDLKNAYTPSSMKDDKPGEGQEDMAMLQAVLHEEGRKMPMLVDYNKLLSEALAAWDNDRPEEALVLFDRAIALDPKRAEGYDYRGTLHHRLGCYEEALENATKCIELEPENASYYYSRGVTLHEMGRYEEALADRNRAIELVPDHALYHDQRAVTLHAMGRYEEALADRNRAVELEPENAQYHDQRGITLQVLKRYEEALADRNRAIELEPENAEYYFGRVVTLYAMERYQEALADAEKATELEPLNAEYWENCGIVLQKLKRKKEAKECFDKAEELKKK